MAGLASLAKSDANKEVIGKMGALAALIELVFKDDKNPTAFVTDRPGGGRNSTGGTMVTRRLYGTHHHTKRHGHHATVGLRRHSLDGQPSLEELSLLPGPPSGAGAGAGTGMEANGGATMGITGGGGGGTTFRVKESSGDLKLTRLSAQTLATLLTNQANQEHFVEAGGLENTYGLIRRTQNVGMRASLASILNNLSKNNEYQARIVNGGGLHAIIDLGGSSDEKVCMHAVSCCKRLSSLSANQHKWPPECLRAVIEWLDEFDHVKLQILAIETLSNLCEDSEMNRVKLVESDGVSKIAQYLDMDRYDDDVRLQAAKCISKIALSAESRPYLAIPEVLDSFRSLLEHGMVVNDVEQLRAALDSLCMLADCAANKVKMSDAGYVEVIFHVMDTVADKILRRSCTKCLMLIGEDEECRDQMMQFIPKIIALMQNHDYSTQFCSTTLLCYLSEKKRCRQVIIMQVSKIMKLLDHWMGVPDEQFNKVAIKLGANLVIDQEAKREVMTILPVMKTFMGMSKTKNPDMQTSAATFLSNMTDTTEEKDRAMLVQVGAVWRLKGIENHGKLPIARQIANTALKMHLGDHVAAIRIQAMYRGRLHRLRAKKREEEAARKAEAKAAKDKVGGSKPKK